MGRRHRDDALRACAVADRFHELKDPASVPQGAQRRCAAVNHVEEMPRLGNEHVVPFTRKRLHLPRVDSAVEHPDMVRLVVPFDSTGIPEHLDRTLVGP